MKSIPLIAIALALLLSGCMRSGLPTLESLPGPSDLPFIHKIDVQQGNVITQDMLAQLQRGMDKKKVNFVMGTPVIKDTFNSDRWDYVYTFKPGYGDGERRQVTLVFEDDKLAYVEGDVVAAEGQLIADNRQDTTVEVPLWQKKTLLSKLKDKIPFTEPEEPEYVYSLPGAKDDKEAEGGAETGEQTSEGDKPSDGEKEATAASDEVFKRPVVDPAEGVTAEADIKSKDVKAPEKDEGVLVPKDAPTNKKEKGFFARVVDSIGLGPEQDDDEVERNPEPVDPKYRDITNPEDL